MFKTRWTTFGSIVYCNIVHTDIIKIAKTDTDFQQNILYKKFLNVPLGDECWLTDGWLCISSALTKETSFIGTKGTVWIVEHSLNDVWKLENFHCY